MDDCLLPTDCLHLIFDHVPQIAYQLDKKYYDHYLEARQRWAQPWQDRGGTLPTKSEIKYYIEGEATDIILDVQCLLCKKLVNHKGYRKSKTEEFWYAFALSYGTCDCEELRVANRFPMITGDCTPDELVNIVAELRGFPVVCYLDFNTTFRLYNKRGISNGLISEFLLDGLNIRMTEYSLLTKLDHQYVLLFKKYGTDIAKICAKLKIYLLEKAKE